MILQLREGILGDQGEDVLELELRQVHSSPLPPPWPLPLPGRPGEAGGSQGGSLRLTRGGEAAYGGRCDGEPGEEGGGRGDLVVQVSDSQREGLRMEENGLVQLRVREGRLGRLEIVNFRKRN